jgi:hypothetical protein
MVIEGLLGGHELDLGGVGESEDDIAEELGAFEPPVAEKLGVKGGHADTLTVGGELIFAEDVLDDVAEVLGVLEDLAVDVVGVVGVLVAQAGLVVSDFPIAQAAFVVFLVEFEVFAGAGVSGGTGPDLLGDAGVTAEGEDARVLGGGDDADGFERMSPTAALVPVELLLRDGAELVAVDDAMTPSGWPPVMRCVSTKK